MTGIEGSPSPKRVTKLRHALSPAAVLGQASHLLGIGGFYLAIIAYFAFAAPFFFTSTNAVNILSNVSVIGVVAIGQALVLIAGGFDLSVSGLVPLGGVTYTVAINDDLGIPEATAVAILGGVLVGILNGFIITKVGINPLVTTLGMLSITGGLAFTISDGVTIPLENVNAAPLGEEFAGMPLYVWTLITLSVIAFLVLRYTVYGRMLYALGGNREASRLAGMRVDLLTISVYAASGACAAFAGVMIVHQLLAGAPAVGGDAALESITAVILGGASLTGGAGGIPGTMIGVLIIGTIANGLALMQVPTFYQDIATGVLLLLAVTFGQLRVLFGRRTTRVLAGMTAGAGQARARWRRRSGTNS
ncbi:MAG: ABC transporter permease [Gaiellaceae bacterium MAG52_C11]|nr:ABC transporter permease [Candidatus Gaiellasilicea maunaloa]